MSASIRPLRKAARVTQEQLAFKAKIPRFRLGLHERGFLELTPQEEAALREALKALMWERQADFHAQLQTVE